MIHSKEDIVVHPIVIPTKWGLKSFNFYLLEQPNSLMLIDAGIDTDSCWELFNETLAKNGFSLLDITHILLTHNHEDHVGLVNRIIEKKDIPIYAHEESIYRLKRDPDYFSLRIQFFQQLYKEMGCGEAGEQQIKKLKRAMVKGFQNRIQANILSIKESDVISSLQVIETPGHSSDHVVFLEPSNKILFSGDHLVSHISSNAIIEPDRSGNRLNTVSDYLQSLNKCLNYDFELVYSGHGDVIEQPKQLLQHRIDRIHQKSNTFLSIIKEGHTTASQLAQFYYKEKYKNEFSLVMSEIIGHLDFLEWGNKIKKEKRDGVWYYF